MNLFILLLCGISLTNSSLEEKNINGSFTPSKEWQEIKKGQGIPVGLHVRINLQTGKKEAKILDETDNNNNHSEFDENQSEGKNYHQLTKSTSSKSEVLAIQYKPDDSEEINKKKTMFKYHKKLRKSNDMRSMFRTDAEIITQLVRDFQNITSKYNGYPDKYTKIQLNILNDLNHLMSQYDNAKLFVNNGGLEYIILPLIVNQTQLVLKVNALRILGAMSQNNPDVQVQVFERNFGTYLTQILLNSKNAGELSSALYAFGSLLRKFPYAQHKILSTSGTQALILLLAKDTEIVIKSKVVTLISDIIIERNAILTNGITNEDKLTVAQYTNIHFTDWLSTHSYCDILATIISENHNDLNNMPNVLEDFLFALDTAFQFCSDIWLKTISLRYALLSLKKQYKAYQDEYRLELRNILDYLIELLYGSLKHDEF